MPLGLSTDSIESSRPTSVDSAQEEEGAPPFIPVCRVRSHLSDNSLGARSSASTTQLLQASSRRTLESKPELRSSRKPAVSEYPIDGFRPPPGTVPAPAVPTANLTCIDTADPPIVTHPSPTGVKSAASALPSVPTGTAVAVHDSRQVVARLPRLIAYADVCSCTPSSRQSLPAIPSDSYRVKGQAAYGVNAAIDSNGCNHHGKWIRYHGNRACHWPDCNLYVYILSLL